MNQVLSLISFLGIIGISLLAGFSRLYGWSFPVELFSHFQVQYLIASVLLLGFLFFTHYKEFFLIACLAVLFTSVNIITWYFPLNPIPAESNLRVLSYNVENNNRHYEQVLAMVRKEDPDIAIFLEMDEVWIEKTTVLKNKLPYLLHPEKVDERGIVIYSRFPLANSSKNIYKISGKTALSTDIIVNQKPIHLIANHSPMPLNSFRDRNRQLDILGTYIQSVEIPVILAGDFNLTMWSPYYRRLIKGTGFKNVRQGFGIFPSWPARSLFPLSTQLFFIPIDHCLVSPEIQVKSIHLGNNAGSDHFPLISDLFV